ncbi:unnamed protein product [Mytilus coruscus]|uniref:G-protein coupled receptors family 1 profile domain-containing protein n=1 Tax=Mytilus coruscus TaxID=42192 RepID=A0A6J8ADC6_MYTCO|nr:unnamed protein product [Mytilus coruscus]
MGIIIAIGNILCIAVCRKALKKTFHRLVVMALCFSNIFTISGSSTIVLTSFFEFQNTGVCIFQYLLSCFGMVLNYSLIFLLCLQRYLTVKSFNFGTVERFDYKKYHWIGGTIITIFLYTLSCLLFIPRNKELSACSRHALYGNNVVAFVVTIFGPVAILIIAVMSISILTSFKIWKIYYTRREALYKLGSFTNNKKQIFPAKASVSDTYKVESKGSDKTIKQKRIVHQVKIFKNRSKVADINNHESYKIEKDDQKARNTKNKSEEVLYKETEMDVEKSGASFFFIQRDISSHNASLTEFSVEKSQTAAARFKDTFQVHAKEEPIDTREAQIRTFEIKGTVSQRDEVIDLEKPTVLWQTTVKPDFVAKHKQSWEVHAFKTSLVISVQTLILTGPMIVAYWIEILSGQRLTDQVNGILAARFKDTFQVHAKEEPIDTREAQIRTFEIKGNVSQRDEVIDVEKPTVSWQTTVKPDFVAKHKQSWEVHAFKTSLVISVQTLILTGPMIVAYWIEILSGQRLTEQINGIVGLPFLVHAFTNPFIYAWRIPDMRREFKKLCDRNY